ncbi:hypothetical protein CCACVL1_01472, partial [Corchorus capsularis]
PHATSFKALSSKSSSKLFLNRHLQSCASL